MAAHAHWMEPSAPTASDEDEDRWHVLVAPGEVKVLTLEQLDDLFRLDIIDENVQVWQPGMQDWQPLSIVAGMDSEPAPAPKPAPAPVKSVPVDPWASPVVSPFGATLPANSYAAPISPISSYSAPESIRPLVVSDPPMMARQSSRGARWLVGLALVAGLGVTLYRNDVFRDMAHSAGQSAAYARIEQALGAPGFGTLSAVDELTKTSLSQASTASLGVSAPAATPAAAPAAPPVAAVPAKSEPAPAPAKAAAEEPRTVSLESLVKESVGAKMEPKAAKASHGPRPHAAPAPRPAGKGPDIGIKGSRHAYDPLNSKL